MRIRRRSIRRRPAAASLPLTMPASGTSRNRCMPGSRSGKAGICAASRSGSPSAATTMFFSPRPARSPRRPPAPETGRPCPSPKNSCSGWWAAIHLPSRSCSVKDMTGPTSTVSSPDRPSVSCRWAWRVISTKIFLTGRRYALPPTRKCGLNRPTSGCGCSRRSCDSGMDS